MELSDAEVRALAKVLDDVEWLGMLKPDERAVFMELNDRVLSHPATRDLELVQRD